MSLGNIIRLWENFKNASFEFMQVVGGSMDNIDTWMESFAQILVKEYYGGEWLSRSDYADIKLKDGKKVKVKAQCESSLYIKTGMSVDNWDFDLLVVILFNKKGEVIKALEFDVEKTKAGLTKYCDKDSLVLSFIKDVPEEMEEARPDEGVKNIIREIQNIIDSELSSMPDNNTPEKNTGEISYYSIFIDDIKYKYFYYDGTEDSLKKLYEFAGGSKVFICEDNCDGKIIKFSDDNEEVKAGDYFVKDSYGSLFHILTKQVFNEIFITLEDNKCIPRHIPDDYIWVCTEFDGTEKTAEDIAYEFGDDYEINDGVLCFETEEYGNVQLSKGDCMMVNPESGEKIFGRGYPVYIVSLRNAGGHSSYNEIELA
ncbi:hypothetical protein [Treponema putidum]|uniref:DUF4365 domain-containing protein n=1 Tax=Treponema putidum TaxID=221027 RepID=A0ABY5HRG6_9SPIR|nr:hypothetical protein [Treponema putidum]UTY27725.1 hypothetical protein E4N76_01025 [Treponema putidum]